jgi:uncharacterized damage-inducible protein DinB
MKELLLQYASYHAWANDLLLELINNLDEEKQKRPLKSSFPSLFETVLHMLDAESIWWQRMKLQERILRPSENFQGDMKEASTQLLQQNRLWREWVLQASEPQLQHAFKYQNTKRESFKQPVAQVLMHVFNHGTYHRGQLVTMLRQLEVEKIPQTDYVIWTHKHPSLLRLA